MPWVQLRSRRDPSFWVPLLACAVLLVVLAFLANARMSEWARHLRELSAADPAAAKAQAVHVLRIATGSLCLVTIGFCAYLFRYFQLGHREGRLPPSGWWSFGALRAAVGPEARSLSRVGRMLPWLLLAATLGLALAVELLIRLLEAGTLSG